MSGLTENQFNKLLEEQRITTLYERLPASVLSVLVGVLLVFVVLLPKSQDGSLKAWAAYMLTTIALRGWFWHLFTSGSGARLHTTRWEWAYALTAFLTGLGWGSLSGPMFPADVRLQFFIIAMTLVIAFAGTVYLSLSHIAFWLFLTPTLGPAIARYTLASKLGIDATVVAALASFTVLLIIQRTLNRFALRSIRRQVEAETLLAEQQAIFQAAPLGILVISEDRIVKCNPRLGELFHRNLSDTLKLEIHELFANQDEAQRFIDEVRHTLKPGKTISALHRLRRADGTEFWAELSGRLLGESGLSRSIWTIADLALRSERYGNGETNGYRAASPAPSFRS